MSLLNLTFKQQYQSIFKEPQDLSLTVDERALLFFEDICGNEPIKKLMYRALAISKININVMLIGPAATSKSMLCKVIEDRCNNVLYYDASAGSTSAGLFHDLRSNPNTRILIIDEIAELNSADLKTFRGLTNNGRISKSIKSDPIKMQFNNLKCFATTNNPTKFKIPEKSRWQMYRIDQYNDDEFIEVLTFCLDKKGLIHSKEKAVNLGYAMLQYDIRDVRKAISICSLIDESTDKEDNISQIIEDYLYNDASKININYNDVNG